MKQRYTSKAYRAYEDAASPSLGEVLADMLYAKRSHIGFLARLKSVGVDLPVPPTTPTKQIEPLSKPEPYNRKRDYARLLEEVKQSPQYAQRQKEKDSLRNLKFPKTTLKDIIRVSFPMRKSVVPLIENFVVFDEVHVGMKTGQSFSHSSLSKIPRTHFLDIPFRPDEAHPWTQKFDHELWRARMTSKGCVPPRGRKQLEHLVRRAVVHRALIEQFVASGFTLNMGKCHDAESKV